MFLILSRSILQMTATSTLLVIQMVETSCRQAYSAGVAALLACYKIIHHLHEHDKHPRSS